MEDELLFHYQAIQSAASKPFSAYLRPNGLALILVQDSEGHWVLARKNRYPTGMSRLIGGGINPGEHPLLAAQRELWEETGLQVDSDKLNPLTHFELTLVLPDDSPITTSIFTFLARSHQPLRAKDDIDQLISKNDQEFRQLIQLYYQLPDTPIDPPNPATWQQYGQLWAPIHATVFDQAKTIAQ